MIADVVWIWARAALLCGAIVVLFCGAGTIVTGVRALLRTRIVRTDHSRVAASQRVIE